MPPPHAAPGVADADSPRLAEPRLAEPRAAEPVMPSAVFMIVLVGIAALAPMSMQIYLPAVPAIQMDFAIAPSLAQLPLSLSMVAIAISTLFYGPLSDRHGRRPLLFIGLALLVIGSLICAAAPNIWVLIAGRIAQAAGAGAGLVLTRAIIRDVFSADRVASVFSYLTIAVVVAPMLSPSIGGVLADLFGWRSVFVFVGVAALAVGVAARHRVVETNTTLVPLPGLAGMLASFGCLLRVPAYCGYALQSAFAISVFFAFSSAAPFVVIGQMGVSAAEYGVYFIIVSLGFMAGNFTAARISRRVGADAMIVVGCLMSLAATSLLALMILVWPDEPLSIFGPATFFALGNGLTMPNAQAGIVNVDPRAAGAATGLSAFLQMVIAASVVQLLGLFHNDTPYPLAIALIACSAAALLAISVPIYMSRVGNR